MTITIDGNANTITGTPGYLSGEVCFFAMATAPAGFLKANGAAVSRTTYAALFAAIGTTYGAGDGSTIFNVPELRGEFLRAWDDGRAVDGGRTLGSAQAQDMQPHRHQLNLTDAGAYSIVQGTNVNAQGAAAANAGTGAFFDASGAGKQLIQNTGTVETRPRNIALLACIRY